MDKRIKIKLYLTTLLVLLCLLFVPSHPVYAYFSDSDSEDAGIELILGSVDLSVNNQSEVNNNILKLGNGNNITETKEYIKNIGTLTGKLAYKISLINDDGTDVNPSILQSMKITLNNQVVNLSNKDSLFTEFDESLEIVPENTKEIPLKVELINELQKNETVVIKIEYLLFQTNGTIVNPLFHDTESTSYKIEIDKKDNLKYFETKNYKAALEMPETFYFTDKEGHHTSLNHGTLYLESTKDKKTEKEWETLINLINTRNWFNSSPFTVVLGETSEKNAVIYFYFDKKVIGNDKQNLFYSEQAKFWLGSLYISNDFIEFDYTAGKILLSSDTITEVRDNKGKILENPIDIRDSANKIITLKYVTKEGSKLKVSKVESNDFVMKADIYINDKHSQKLKVDSNVELSLTQSVGESGNLFDFLWNIIKNIFGFITGPDEIKLNIELNNDITKQKTTLSRKIIKNIFNRNFSATSRAIGDTKETILNTQKKTTSNQTAVHAEERPLIAHTQNNENSKQENKSETIKEMPEESLEESSDLVKQPPKIPSPPEEGLAIDEDQSEENVDVPQGSPEKLPNLDEPPEDIYSPADEEFEYVDVQYNGGNYSIGFTQAQLDWLTSFETLDEFTANLNKKTPILYVKYDKVEGIENIEQFVNDLTAKEPLQFTFDLKVIHERELLEIDFTKQ